MLKSNNKVEGTQRIEANIFTKLRFLIREE